LSAWERLGALGHPVLLEGVADHDDLGRWSYLSADPLDRVVVTAAEWPMVAERIRSTWHAAPDATLPPFVGGWIGWLGYELGAAFDHQPGAPRDHFSQSDGELALHDWVIAWNHGSGRCWLVSTGIDCTGHATVERARARAGIVLSRLSAPEDRLGSGDGRSSPRGGTPTAQSHAPDAYREAVAAIIEAVRSGEIFQANLSQRWVVECSDTPLALYRRLRAVAPASHAALLPGEGRSIVSASPESFLRYDAATRLIASRPIKGTRPRDADPTRDADLARALVASPKDRAENVMIVDLVRNDLLRVAEPESVGVPALCRLDSHATVHHLSSTVTGRLRDRHDALDLLAACFPAGSITGAPKLRAMEVLADHEPVARGAYCGAIGWIGLDGSLGLSVAIRTLIQAGHQVAVHAGGGITLQSDPDAEYRESLDKARALLGALGVDA